MTSGGHIPDPLASANIFSFGAEQIAAVRQGEKNPGVRYATREPLVLNANATIQIPNFVEVARFPSLGFRRFTGQFSAQYPLDPSTSPAQLHYYLTSYKDVGSPKPFAGGLLSPPYDQANEETEIDAKAIGLLCKLVGVGTNLVILLSFSILLEP